MVVQDPAGIPHVAADVAMMVSPSSTISVGVDALRKGYEKGFEVRLRKLGIEWRDNLEQVPKALEVYCSEEISKIEGVIFTGQ